MTTLSTRVTRMLLVSDDPDVINLFTRLIERSFKGRIETKVLATSEDARAYVQTEEVDVLVADLENAGPDGTELLPFAKRKNPAMRALLLVGPSTLDTWSDAPEIRAADCLPKPIDESKLSSMLRRARRPPNWLEEGLARILAICSQV